MNRYAAYRILSYVLAGMLPLLLYMVVSVMYGIPLAWTFAMVGVVMSLVIGRKMTNHPLINALEGKGILTLSIDSTGNIVPYICPVYRGKVLDPSGNETIFNRENLTYLYFPKVAGAKEVKVISDDGNVTTEYHIVIPKNILEYKFGFDGIPVFLWNENLQTFLPKDFLASFELATVKLSLVRGIDHKVSDLSSSIKNFARYVVDQIRPKKGIPFGGLAIGLIVIVIIVFVLAMMFGGSGVTKHVGSLVTPR